MARYKSVLMAQRDAREFPHPVGLPIPPFGLGKRLDIIAAWLNANIGQEWRLHNRLEKGEHTACYLFRTQEAADRFRLYLGDPHNADQS
jgi:hypothetical protein